MNMIIIGATIIAYLLMSVCTIIKSKKIILLLHECVRKREVGT